MEDKKYHYKVTGDGTDVLDQNDEVTLLTVRSQPFFSPLTFYPF